MSINVTWLNYRHDAIPRGYWDQGILEDLFDGQIWSVPEGYEFVHHLSPPSYGGSIVVVPARHNASLVERLNSDVSHLEWVLFILTGDEEGIFPVDRLSHPNMAVWLMTPQDKEYPWFVTKFIGTGYPNGLRQYVLDVAKEGLPERENVFFSGQDTHARRHECIRAFKTAFKSLVEGTDGFTKGMVQTEYWDCMLAAKVAPCPGGPVSPDTFRVFEALETGAVPLIDNHSGQGPYPGFWPRIFGDTSGMFFVDEWNRAHTDSREIISAWPKYNSRSLARWIKYKRDLAYDLRDEIERLSGEHGSDLFKDRVTVLMPSSVIKSHPSTHIIEETMDSLMNDPGLAGCEIILMLDGVRSQQRMRRHDYEKYLYNVVWLCHTKWKNVLPVIHDEHLHQGMMTRLALEEVKTDMILFVEQDTPICGEIPWNGMSEWIKSGKANLIRLHHEARIHPEHKHLMVGAPQDQYGVRLTKTIQWSQRPHLASAEFYRWMTNLYFGKDSRTMIEDVMYSVLESHWKQSADRGWSKFRTWIYTPSMPDIKRSYHTDGREGESKYTMIFSYDNEGSAIYAPHAGEFDG